MRRMLMALTLVLMPGMAAAVECGQMRFEQADYTVCKAQPAEDQLRLFLTDPDSGRPYGSFENVSRQLSAEGKALRFAMNAGMYHSDRSPVGHYVEDGEARAPVITTPGPGNFGLLPNGVFCVREGRADVFETKRFVRQAPACTYASQSGPMLVIDGALHPRFLKNSDSFHIRNGVGSSDDGRTVWFAISNRTVNFHTFGRFFRDKLGVNQALYFDGKISRLYAQDLDRNDGGFPMGPIIGAVE